jgi:hypothetical protein
MLLLVCTDETIGFVLGLGKLDAECLVCLFEMCDFCLLVDIDLNEIFIIVTMDALRLSSLCTKGVDGFDEAVLFLMGCALRCGELVTKFLNGLLEISYLFVSHMD